MNYEMEYSKFGIAMGRYHIFCDDHVAEGIFPMGFEIRYGLLESDVTNVERWDSIDKLDVMNYHGLFDIMYDKAVFERFDERVSKRFRYGKTSQVFGI